CSRPGVAGLASARPEPGRAIERTVDTIRTSRRTLASSSRGRRPGARIASRDRPFDPNESIRPASRGSSRDTDPGMSRSTHARSMVLFPTFPAAGREPNTPVVGRSGRGCGGVGMVTRVAVVDDQTVFRELLAELLVADPAYEVVGQ